MNTVKRLCLLIILFPIALHLFAQNYYEEEQKVFTGGLILGANFAKVEDQDDFSHYHKVGLNTGAVVYVHFTKSFSVSLELLYSQKGNIDINTSYSNSVGTYFQEYDLDLQYAEVPVMLHYTEGKMDFEIGAYYARLINSTESAFSDPPILIDPVLNSFNKTDWGFIFGLSYKLTKHVWVNARFDGSLFQIRPPERLPLGYAFDGQLNNVFNLRLIYLF